MREKRVGVSGASVLLAAGVFLLPCLIVGCGLFGAPPSGGDQSPPLPLPVNGEDPVVEPVPDEVPEPVPDPTAAADFDGDGVITQADADLFADALEGSADFDPKFDLNADGAIDLLDWAVFVALKQQQGA